MQPPLRRAGKPLRAAEFFAGIGLVRLALERQNWQVVFANDIDPDKREMYEANFADSHFHLGDIHKIDVADLPSCDLFTASFPCNDLSIAGAGAGLGGKESSAFWGLIHILQNLGPRRPPLVMLENVLGFLQSDGGKDFELALLALNELGYAVDAIVLNAKHWTPQSRVRLFVVASARSDFTTPTPVLRYSEEPDRSSKNPALRRTSEPASAANALFAERFPSALAMESEIRPAALAAFINAHQNIRWSLRDLPPPPKPHLTLKDIVEDLPDGDPHWWNEKRAEYFFAQLSERHLAIARQMIDGVRIHYATAFRRVRHGKSMAELRTDGIAGCLRTPRGGSGRQILFKAGRGRYQVRLLTPRECARLQGVSDDYKIDVPLNQALFGFGDAVCVPAVSWIAEHYLTPVALSMQPSAGSAAVAHA